MTAPFLPSGLVLELEPNGTGLETSFQIDENVFYA